MERKRLLEIALSKLVEERDSLDTEIADIQTELKPNPIKRRKRRKMPAAKRKELSRRMKKVWSERKKNK